MAWSSGTFTGQNGPTEHADRETAHLGITSAILDSDRNELVTGINACLTKDGSNALTGNFNAGSHQIIGVANGTSRTHAPNIGQIQDGALIYAIAGGTPDALTLTLTPPLGAYAEGMRIRFKATNGNATGAPTLNINNVGAKTIVRALGAPLQQLDIFNGSFSEVIFDSSADKFILQNPLCQWIGWTPTIAATGGTCSATTTNGIYKIDPTGEVTFRLAFTTTYTSSVDSSFFSFTIPQSTADLRSTFTCQISNSSFSDLNSFGFGFLHDTTKAYIGFYGYTVGIARNNTFNVITSGSYRWG